VGLGSWLVPKRVITSSISADTTALPSLSVSKALNWPAVRNWAAFAGVSTRSVPGTGAGPVNVSRAANAAGSA
jgi:hypothetical protein